MFAAVAMRKTDWRHGSGSTAAAVWCWLTAEEVEDGVVAADVLAVRWLEERWLMLECQLVNTAVVCKSVGSSSQTEDFQRSLKVPICCVDFLRL